MRYSIILVAILSIPVLAYSDTIIVPDDYPSIQEAIDTAVNGDTVLVKPGTYVDNIDFKGKAITVRSELGSETTIIDGGNPTNPDFGSVVLFQSGEGADSVLDGFTLKNGSGTKTPASNYHGGGIICYQDSCPTIINNIVTANSTSEGGGISCLCSSPNITNNIILGNNAWYTGGGIECIDSSPTITNNVISGNQADSGAGIWCEWDSSPTIVNNTIIGNKVVGSGNSACGGGIGFENSSPAIINNIISGNEATLLYGTNVDGGGIFCHSGSGSSACIIGNLISGNSVTAHPQGGTNGGGIACGDFAIITNNIITGNDAEFGGGGICCFGSSTITNNTITGNKAGWGGGIYFGEESYATLTNTILWENSAYNGPEIFVFFGSPTVAYSDIKGGYTGTGNIDSDPLFVDPANDDFHLTFLSPCRGSGDNSAVTEFYDFEGDPRIAWGGTVDMGADEFYTHLYVTGDKAPGGSIQGKFVGLPGTNPVGLFIGSNVLPSPIPTMWGDYWLQAPWFLFPLVPIPSNGVLVLPTTLPGSIPAPYNVPMQALIGLNADSLTNLCVLEVR